MKPCGRSSDRHPEGNVERRAFLKTGLAVSGAAASGVGAPLAAQDVVKLRIAHMVPPMHVAHHQLLTPWAQRLEKDSGGRIKCEIYPSMQLGGKPPELYDQARNGVADIIWTVPAYTPGRFPLTTVFDLPFVTGNTAEVTARAIWSFYKKHLRNEYKDVHPLLLHCHAPGFVHMKDTLVQRMEDLKGRKLRLPSKPIGDAVRLMGATPVGMPATEAYEALSRGVAEGVLFPWEPMKAFRLNEMTRFHTVTELYTTVFLVAMNRAKYESLPPDLKQVIDRNSGDNWIDEAGRIWDAADLPSLEQARQLGHTITRLAPEEKERWRKVTQPVVDAWITDTPNGKTLYQDAVSLIAGNQK